jgi:hypothetical protein
MTGTPSAVKFTAAGRSQTPAGREAQNRRYLERMATASGVAGILSDAAKGAAEDLARRRAEFDELYRSREETAAALREAQYQVHDLHLDRVKLLEQAETLRRVEQGGWWRLRQRLLPVLRAARALRRSKR